MNHQDAKIKFQNEHKLWLTHWVNKFLDVYEKSHLILLIYIVYDIKGMRHELQATKPLFWFHGVFTVSMKLQASYSNSFNIWKTHSANCETSSWRADIITKRQSSESCSLNTASHVWQWMNYISNRMTESYGPFPLFITHESSHPFMFAAWHTRESKRVSSEPLTYWDIDITTIKEVFRGNNALNFYAWLKFLNRITAFISKMNYLWPTAIWQYRIY